MELLSTRGYRPIELTSVMFRELDRLIEKRQRNESLTTRVISFDEIDLWARTSADGWATEHEGLADFMFSFGRIGAQCKGAFPYLAELDGNPISTGSLLIYDEHRPAVSPRKTLRKTALRSLIHAQNGSFAFDRKTAIKICSLYYFAQILALPVESADQTVETVPHFSVLKFHSSR